MNQSPASLSRRLAPAETIFFTWLNRVLVAGILVGSAWIDDAPPLDIAAMIIAAYVAIRVATLFGEFTAAAPFDSRALKIGFAVVALVLLGLSFLVVVTFVDRLAVFVAG